MNVYILREHKTKKVQEIVSWCEQQFTDVVRVNSPTIAELHRVSYDNQITGLIVFYFKDERDYVMFALRWQ